MQKIEIGGKKYRVIDAKEYMTIPDCFVLKNKTGKGHGEAKFYVGNDNATTMRFFDNFIRKCIFLKSDLQKYLEDAKIEYKNPEQNYKNKSDLPETWEKYMKEVDDITQEIIEFSFFRSDVEPPRVYINSNDNIYKLLRKIALPQISYLSVLKIKSEDNKTIYYFKPFIDFYYFGDNDHPQIIKEEEQELEKDNTLAPLEREQITRARIGQGAYREELLEEFPVCIYTGVSDERLLIASHIKPWVKSDNHEKIDPKNGLIFTPTYDCLFDRGFITFEDDGTLLISPWLSPMNQKRLSLSPRRKCEFCIDGRHEYLKYHRENIFKK